MAKRKRQNYQKNQNPKLSEKEVVETLQALDKAFDVLEFAKESDKIGAYSPYLQNSLMQSLNIDTQTPQKDEIEKALNAPADNEDKLISYNQSFYFNSLMVKRNHEYLANLPSFDLEISCKNITSADDYNTPTYKKDLATVKTFLSKFDYRKEFKRAYWNMLMNESYFCILREFDSKNTLQELPFQYSKLTGRFEYGLLYDFDMSYFLQPQVDINLYPNWFKKKYKEVFLKGNQKRYIPSNTLNNRGGIFATWTQTDPTEGFWCFKFNPNHNLQVPFFTGLLPEMAIVPMMRNLQVDQSFAAARKLLVSEIPYLTEKKSASVANSLAISSDVLGKFIALATAGLTKAIKVLALPTENIKGVEFTNTDKDTYENFMTITSSLLSGGKVIFSTNDRMNVIETQLSLNIDEMLAESVYPQFEDFLDFFINNKTKKYKFKFKFVGCDDYIDRKRRQEEIMPYIEKGVVLPNKIASSLGLNKFELEEELREAKASNFTDSLIAMINLNTMASGQKNEAGRPAKDDGDLSNSGSDTRTSGSNIEKGGKT